LRPLVFVTLISNSDTAAPGAMSTVASTSVALTNVVLLTVTPAGSVVPDLKNSERAPLAKFLPVILTTSPTVSCSPDGGLAAVTDTFWAAALFVTNKLAVIRRPSARQTVRELGVMGILCLESMDLLSVDPCGYGRSPIITA